MRLTADISLGKKVETRKCCDDIFYGLKEKQNKSL